MSGNWGRFDTVLMCPNCLRTKRHTFTHTTLARGEFRHPHFGSLGMVARDTTIPRSTIALVGRPMP